MEHLLLGTRAEEEAGRPRDVSGRPIPLDWAIDPFCPREDGPPLDDRMLL